MPYPTPKSCLYDSSMIEPSTARAHRWLNRFRRLLVRWEKKPANYIALLHFARGLIAFRATELFG